MMIWPCNSIATGPEFEPLTLSAIALLSIQDAATSQTSGNAESSPLNLDKLEENVPRETKSVIDLQPYRTSNTITIRDNAGRGGTAALINLNPWINTWFILLLQWADENGVTYYHLESAAPLSDTISISQDFPHGLMINSSSGQGYCSLWDNPANNPLTQAVQSGSPFAPICGGRLLVRNKTQGNKSTLESVTDLLRRHVWQGEKITTFVRETFYKDAYLAASTLVAPAAPEAISVDGPPDAPLPPLINAQFADYMLTPTDLGIALDSETEPLVQVGRWYRAKDLPGIFISVIQPDLIAPSVLARVRSQVNPLDNVEGAALVYLVAFDLELFDLGFEMGTEHPRVNWSDRVPEHARDPMLPGPDGIGNTDPLAMTGIVTPGNHNRVAAAFAGGFKRYHGAFKWSDLALKNNGSHYGFMEYGTILSKLQPALATVLISSDGRVDLKTWTEKDDTYLARIRHARQNGLPIIDYNPDTGGSSVGKMVPRWALGNWSGSVDERCRTVRAGLALQENENQRFLIFAYFSAATPSAMARVFAAYQCRYAMMLDINALEHTYLAVYHQEDSRWITQHLITGMDVLDKKKNGHILSRFVDFPDNRDFFYLLRKARP